MHERRAVTGLEIADLQVRHAAVSSHQHASAAEHDTSSSAGQDFRGLTQAAGGVLAGGSCSKAVLACLLILLMLRQHALLRSLWCTAL